MRVFRMVQDGEAWGARAAVVKPDATDALRPEHPVQGNAACFVLLIVCSIKVIVQQRMALQTTVPTMPRAPSPSLRAALAGNVRAFRKQHGYSQEQLADLCELHRTYIGSVEREERNVSLSTLEVLAEALEVSVPELLTQGAGRERGKVS